MCPTFVIDVGYGRGIVHIKEHSYGGFVFQARACIDRKAPFNSRILTATHVLTEGRELLLTCNCLGICVACELASL
jgi:hypothetical protein